MLNNNNFSGIIISEIQNLINAEIIDFQDNNGTLKKIKDLKIS